MGLLTDPAGFHGRPIRLLVKNQSKICFLLYVASVVWYCLLAHDQVNSATYLSENALLPGLVTVGCVVGSATSATLVDLRHELARRQSAGDVSMPSAWIRARISDDVALMFVSNFQKYTGKNVYGVIRGGGASTEAIVLSVPFRGSDSVHPSTDPSLALLLTIGACFRKQKYWAKDIILLVTEHEQLGMQAWLEAYHGTTCGTEGVLESGDVMGRGGSIQAAVNLQVYSSRVRSIDVKLSGLNGQLPNLDLANLVHRICSKERVRHTFANKEKAHGMNTNEQWLHSLHTMTSMVLTQASGVPDGNHGLFHRFGIEAVTLEGYGDEQGPTVPLQYIGRVIEGVFRSINNLLERFHQSYFFYLLVDTDRFVSIGHYMPCVGLLVGALFIRAFAFYLNLEDLLRSKLMKNKSPVKPVSV
ncbi:hypothetical protein AAG570_007307 [Ranatra chinensis]|uniref:Glycosylphosphatidylinositol anchor attachment 1 protein n=1 Tax=Ranatra chinensis TaxID=642074 RepID=A0ABD0XVH4_9HEMI